MNNQSISSATDSVVLTIQVGELLLNRVQRACRQYGLTFSTANVLTIIDGADEPLSPGEISSRLLVTGGAVTQLLDALEKKCLVQRTPNPRDRRSTLIQITEEGKALRQQIESHLHRQDAVWMDVLEEEDRAKLASLLDKVREHLQNLEASVSPS